MSEMSEQHEERMDEAGASGVMRTAADNPTGLLCVMSMFAFTLFAVVDPYMVTGSLAPLFGVRVGAIVLGGLTLVASFTPFGRKYNVQLGMFIALVTGAVVVVLTEKTGGATSAYWPMVILTFFTASLVLPMRASQAFVTYGAVGLFFDLWLIAHGATGTQAAWVGSNAGVWLSILVSVAAVEFMSRKREQLLASNSQLTALNAKLRQEIQVREQAERAIARTQQLDAVGRLAAGLAHELNNLLMVISSSAESIARSERGADLDAERIIASAQQGGKLTSDLLLFARENKRENAPFYVNGVVENVAEVIRRSHRGRMQVELALEQSDLYALGDSQLVFQALFNLCLNGAHAMSGEGTLVIKTSTVTVNGEDGVLPAGDMVRVVVSDTGCGMSDEQRLRAFDPFYTTKPPGEGTGLGVSMAYGILRNHGGDLQLKSELGVGTQAMVTLPLTKRRPALVEPSPEERGSFPDALALLVDDDDLVREVMRDNLTLLGFRVEAVANGAEALAFYRSVDEPVAVILLDLIMPTMSGKEAFEKIRDLGAGQPIVLYSGLEMDDSINRLLETGNARFLRKPFRLEELRVVLSDVILNDVPPRPRELSLRQAHPYEATISLKP